MTGWQIARVACAFDDGLTLARPQPMDHNARFVPAFVGIGSRERKEGGLAA
jgi:hypothetical protein